MKSGYHLYDSQVERAIKYFQQDAGLKMTGIFDQETKSALEKWSTLRTTLRLGVRDLSTSTFGDDVAELIRLLQKAGFPPDRSKIENDGKKYTEDVAMAVRVFQAFYGLPVTGIADLKTINKLKSLVK